MQDLPLIDLFFHLKRPTEKYGLDIENSPSVQISKALLETRTRPEKLTGNSTIRWPVLCPEASAGCTLFRTVAAWTLALAWMRAFNMTTLSGTTRSVSTLSSQMSQLAKNTTKLSCPRSSDREDKDTTTTTIYRIWTQPDGNGCW